MEMSWWSDGGQNYGEISVEDRNCAHFIRLLAQKMQRYVSNS